MKLNAEQLDQIKAFISKRGFTYPDVQLEIIDHVASRVEALMTEKPELPIDEAIRITHGEFGVMGFSVFEDAMVSSLQTQYFKLFAARFSSFFHWKYLPLMAAFTYLTGQAYKMVGHPQYFVVGGLISLLICLIVTGVVYELKYKKYRKLLTMRMGNAYMVICGISFNIWNILGTQLKVYHYLQPQWAGILFGVMYMLTIILFITVNAIRQNTIASCRKLESKYKLL